jgi:bifunctional non-homologous end joining protein LigD
MWDGYRSIIHKIGIHSRLYSKAGGPLSAEFVELLPSLGAFDCHSALLDGVIIAIGEDGRPSHDLLEQRDAPRLIHCVIFDLLVVEGHDLRDMPLWQRRAVLQKIFPEGVPHISLSPMLTGDPDELLRQARQMHVAGLIAKRGDLPYECGQRSGSWLKHRAEKEGTFVIGGYTPGPHGFEDLILGERQGRSLRYAARLRAGFLPASRQRIMEALEPITTGSCPFRDLPETGEDDVGGQSLDNTRMPCCRWVRPEVRVEVAYAERNPMRKLRCPRFLSLADSGPSERRRA